jgi:hypothetical protein
MQFKIPSKRTRHFNILLVLVAVCATARTAAQWTSSARG